MSTSRDTGPGIPGVVPRSLLDALLSLSRYDVVLAAIPLVFAVALAAYLVWAVSLQVAVAAGALSSALLLVDALYLNPPSGSDAP